MEFVLEQYAGILNLEHENTRTRVFLHTHSRNLKRTVELITGIGYLLLLPIFFNHRTMHKLLLKAHVQQDGSVKGKLVPLHPHQYQSTQEMAVALLVTIVSKAPEHLLLAPQARSATALVHGLQMTVLIALPVSTVKGTITHFQLDHVHLAFFVPRVLELTCPNPMDFCALLVISVRDKLQNRRNVTQVC